MHHTNHINEFEPWRQRRDELMRELEDERLARLLRARRRERNHRIQSTPLDRVRGRVRALLRMAPGEEG